MKPGDRLKQFRSGQLDPKTGRKPTQDAVAEAINLTRQQYTNLENNRTAIPEYIYIRLSELWNIPVSTLRDQKPDEVFTSRDQTQPHGAYILATGDIAILPVWRGIAASADQECYFVEPDSPEFQEVPAFFVRGDPQKHVVCIAAGTSMSPRIRQGYRLVVLLNPQPSPNTMVICEREDRSRVVKILREGPNGFELHSINKDHPPILDTKGWTFIGSVVAIWGDYEAGQANIEWDAGRPLRA